MPPWSVEERPACYIVNDATGFALARVLLCGRQSLPTFLNFHGGLRTIVRQRPGEPLKSKTCKSKTCRTYRPGTSRSSIVAAIRATMSEIPLPDGVANSRRHRGFSDVGHHVECAFHRRSAVSRTRAAEMLVRGAKPQSARQAGLAAGLRTPRRVAAASPSSLAGTIGRGMKCARGADDQP